MLLWRPSWISDQNDLSHFDLQITLILPVKFRVDWLFCSKVQNRFSSWQLWRPYSISDQNKFSYFYLQVTQILPTMFRVNYPFGSEGDALNRFPRQQPWQPFWISDRNDFTICLSKSHTDASYQVSSQQTFRFRRRSEKIYFRDGVYDGHLGFPIRTTLAIFGLLITLMLPNKYKVP